MPHAIDPDKVVYCLKLQQLEPPQIWWTLRIGEFDLA